MPSLAIVSSTLFWGTLWIPLRRLDSAGLSVAWATLAGFTLPMVVLFPLAVFRRPRIAAGGVPLLRSGLVMAVCIALYAEALLRGYVTRAILLFYLTPVWSALLGRWMLGEPITTRRAITIAFGLTGMFVVFGLGEGVPLPGNVAEYMALLSGFCWVLSMTYVRWASDSSDFDKTFVFFLFVGIVFSLLTLIPGGRSWSAPSTEIISRSLGWLLALGLFWMPAVIWLTMFGASRLDPGRVAVLLMLEIVVGLVSAALFAHEPIGSREVVGAVLIVGASATEFCAVSAAPYRKTRSR